MGKLQKSEKGFSAVEIILVLVIVVLIGAVGWLIYRNHHKATTAAVTTTASTKPVTPTTPTQPVNPYAGWNTYTSPLAKFSIKYPATWAESETTKGGTNVEYLTIKSSNFIITANSGLASDVTNGTTSCVTSPSPCLSTISTQTFTVPKLGAADVDAVTYTLDSGAGNQLIVKLADGNTEISSPTASGIGTQFSGLSNLSSEKAYQTETPAQFTANPDYKTALSIFESISY